MNTINQSLFRAAANAVDFGKLYFLNLLYV